MIHFVILSCIKASCYSFHSKQNIFIRLHQADLIKVVTIVAQVRDAAPSVLVVTFK